MIICHARQFIFFHNPKCAGTSFRDMLKPYHDDEVSFWGVFRAPYFQTAMDYTHMRLWELQANYPRLFACIDQYNTLIFVRNPYLRFLSAISEHFKKFQKQIDLEAMDEAARIGVIENFLTRHFSMSLPIAHWPYIHFSPQMWQLRLTDRILPRHIIPMDGNPAFMREGLRALDLPEIPALWHNPSPQDLSGLLRSEVVRHFVATVYAEDFTFLASRPELAHLAVLPGKA
jgi:hypothetical protein